MNSYSQALSRSDLFWANLGGPAGIVPVLVKKTDINAGPETPGSVYDMQTRLSQPGTHTLKLATCATPSEGGRMTFIGLNDPFLGDTAPFTYLKVTVEVLP